MALFSRRRAALRCHLFGPARRRCRPGETRVSETGQRTSGVGERVVAIHQPNFLPWLGYFDKLARCDMFVLLDSVQFPKRNGTWMNRVKVLVGGEAAWV